MRLAYAAVIIALLGGCSGGGAFSRLSPAQQLATMEVNGESPTETLTSDAESLLQWLTLACDENAAEIVAIIDKSKAQTLASGRQESAMEIGSEILATSMQFKQRDCGSVAEFVTYSITH